MARVVSSSSVAHLWRNRVAPAGRGGRRGGNGDEFLGCPPACLTALQDTEARVAAIVNAAADGIITIDERGVIESVNPAAERMFGYAARELVGRNVSMLMPEPYRAHHDAYVRHYLRTGQAKVIGTGREVVGRRRDGATFPMDLAVSEFRVGGKRMFAGIARDITERRRLEREIVETVNSEQRRIGQDLHDGLCQHLAGISFACEVLRGELAAKASPEVKRATEIGEMADEAMGQARAIARGLQPVTRDAGGLASALQHLAASIGRVFRVSCVLACRGRMAVHDDAVATHLYRIAQEAVGNAVRHGKATRVRIELIGAGGRLVLRVEDDGVGIGRSVQRAGGMGLHVMHYRARMIGATLHVGPGRRGGTLVSCTLDRVGHSAGHRPQEANGNGNQANEEGHRTDRRQSGAADASRPARGRRARQVAGTGGR